MFVCLGSSDINATPFKGLNHLFFFFFFSFFFLPPALLETVTQFLEKLSDQLSERYVFSLRYFCKQTCISRAEGFMYYKISHCCLCFDEIKSKTVSEFWGELLKYILWLWLENSQNWIQGMWQEMQATANKKTVVKYWRTPLRTFPICTTSYMYFTSMNKFPFILLSSPWFHTAQNTLITVY